MFLKYHLFLNNNHVPPLVWKKVIVLKSSAMIKQLVPRRLGYDVLFLSQTGLCAIDKHCENKSISCQIHEVWALHEEGKMHGTWAVCVCETKMNWNVSNSKYTHTGTKQHTSTKLLIIT